MRIGIPMLRIPIFGVLFFIMKFRLALAQESMNLNAPNTTLGLEPAAQASTLSSPDPTPEILLPVPVAVIARTVMSLIPWGDIFESVFGSKSSADQERSEFTRSTVTSMQSVSADFNYIVCCTSHDRRFYGIESTDWAQTSQILETSKGKINYTVYTFRAGEFRLDKTVGDTDWAHAGNVIYQTADDRYFNFSMPSTTDNLELSPPVPIGDWAHVSGSERIAASLGLVALMAISTLLRLAGF